MRENDEINGIEIDDREIQMSTFPDDVDFLLSNVKSLICVHNCVYVFQELEQATGSTGHA